MSESVADPWRDAVDVRDLTDADFERRNVSVAVYNVDSDTVARLDELCDEHDLDRSAMMDRALRLYLAYRLDREDAPDLRAEYGITVLLPPREWIAQHYGEFPTIGYDDYDVEDVERLDVSTAQTIVDILDDVKPDDVARGDIITTAVHYTADGAQPPPRLSG